MGPQIAHLPPKGCLQRARAILNLSLIGSKASCSEIVQQLRRIMRGDWELTRLEMALFVAGVALMATGFMWATGIG
jgi:hypothetical protein